MTAHAGRDRVVAAASAATVLALVSASLVACTSGDPELVTAPEPSSSFVTVERRDIESVLVAEGTVVAQPRAAVLAPLDGDLEVTVEAGATFEPGDPIAYANGVAVTAEYRGTVEEVLSSSGAVLANMPILSVSYAGWGVSVVVPSSDLYRLYEGPVSGTVNVDSGPSGLPCRVATPADRDQPGAMLCLLPQTNTLAPGLSARVGLPTAERDDVLVLPVTAVSGRVEAGVVSRLNADGTQSRIDVVLGITDGVNIEVVSGLTEGDEVASSPPGLR